MACSNSYGYACGEPINFEGGRINCDDAFDIYYKGCMSYGFMVLLHILREMERTDNFEHCEIILRVLTDIEHQTESEAPGQFWMPKRLTREVVEKHKQNWLAKGMTLQHWQSYIDKVPVKAGYIIQELNDVAAMFKIT